MRDVLREAAGAADDTQLTPLWWFYPVETVKILAWTGEGWQGRSLTDKNITGLAQKSTVFGEGAERVVHQFCVVSEAGRFMEKISRYVAKEGRFNEDLMSEPLEFHKSFCKTQFAAEELAKVFNGRLAKIPGVTSVPPWT